MSRFDLYEKFASEVKKDDLIIVEDGRLHQAASVHRTPTNILIVLDIGGGMRHAKSLGHA